VDRKLTHSMDDWEQGEDTHGEGEVFVVVVEGEGRGVV